MDCLKTAIEENGEPEDTEGWEAIINVNPVLAGRTASSLKNKWKGLKKGRTKSVYEAKASFWTDEQKQCLQDGVEKFGEKNWQDIIDAYQDVLGGRTALALQRKWWQVKGEEEIQDEEDKTDD